MPLLVTRLNKPWILLRFNRDYHLAKCLVVMKSNPGSHRSKMTIMVCVNQYHIRPEVQLQRTDCTSTSGFSTCKCQTVLVTVIASHLMSFRSSFHSPQPRCSRILFQRIHDSVLGIQLSKSCVLSKSMVRNNMFLVSRDPNT